MVRTIGSMAFTPSMPSCSGHVLPNIKDETPARMVSKSWLRGKAWYLRSKEPPKPWDLHVRNIGFEDIQISKHGNRTWWHQSFPSIFRNFQTAIEGEFHFFNGFRGKNGRKTPHLTGKKSHETNPLKFSMYGSPQVWMADGFEWLKDGWRFSCLNQSRMIG